MQGKRAYSRVLGFIAIGLIAAGCALSPQNIDVAPVVQTKPQSLGAGRSLALTVIDKRANPWFGTLGGIYSNTAYIQPAGDITSSIRQALVAPLTSYGFVVQPPGAPGEINMAVEIEDISYQGSGTPKVNHVEASATIALIAHGPRGEYSGRAKVKESKDVILAPKKEENQEMINAAVAGALQRLLERAELLEFLRP